MDDVMEGGDEEHDAHMRDIAKVVTFGKIKDVKTTPEGVLFNGRRFYQKPDFTIKFNMTDYIGSKLNPVFLSRAKDRVPASKSNVTEVSIETEDEAWCVRTNLPDGIRWAEIKDRRVCLTNSGVEVEPWRDVHSCSYDELRLPLSNYGLPPSKLTIQYRLKEGFEVDSPARRLLNEEELGQLRSTVAGLNWTARQGSPDGAAAASIVAGSFPTPTVADARLANATVQRLKDKPTTIVLWSIPEDDLRRLLIMDSAFDTSGNNKSQHGWIVCYTTPQFAQGKTSQVSIVAWKSRRLRRKAGSSLLCESLSGTAATSAFLWIATFDMSMRYTGFRHGDSLTGRPKEEPTVLTRQTRLMTDPMAQVVMDAKSLYDSSSQNSKGRMMLVLHLKCHS